MQIRVAQGNVAAADFYTALDIPDNLAHFVNELSYASNLLAIREDRIVLPFAAFPVAKNFRHIRELNSAVISLQLALKVCK